MADSFSASTAELLSALRHITERLANELARPTPSAPPWTDWQWTLAQAVAAMHGVSPLLHSTLRWRGPPAWTSFLESQRAHTETRHLRIERLLIQLDAATRAANVPAVALKGAALHDMRIYAPGERPMADIDLLVRPSDVRRTTGVLNSLGFRASHTSWKETVFMPVLRKTVDPLGEHSANDLKIELHERIGERLPWRISDISGAIYPPSSCPGLNPYSSLAALFLHVTLHAAGAMTSKSLRLLHLHDLALLSSRMTAADWQRLLDYSGAQRLWWAYPPLRLMLRYYPDALPRSVLDSLDRQCSGILRHVARRRTLTQVSYSHPWVDALPGIEWCQSLTDFFSYVANRVRPSKSHNAWRAATLESEAWAARNDWLALSTTQRILRFLRTRQARPVALHAITAAFDAARS